MLRLTAGAFSPSGASWEQPDCDEMMKRLLPVLLAVSLFAAACGSSSPTLASKPTAGSPALQAVVFAFSDLSSFRQAGATAQVSAVGIFANLRAQDVTSTCANWLSDTSSVLTVNSGGLMTARSSSGSATISTTCQGVSASGLVTLNPTLTPIPTPPPVPTPPAASCPSPPYEITQDSNGRLHCRQKKNGEFALDACCGLP